MAVPLVGQTIRRPMLVALFAAVFAANAAAATPLAPGATAQRLYAVRETGGGLGVMVEALAAFARVRESGGSEFWVAEERRATSHIGQVSRDGTVVRPFGWDHAHRWIDGRDCPALGSVVEALATAASDKPKESFNAPLDGFAAAVQGPGVGQDFRFGPYESWWLEAQAKLTPCWRADPPLVAGIAAGPLVTEAEEVRVEAAR